MKCPDIKLLMHMNIRDIIPGLEASKVVAIPLGWSLSRRKTSVSVIWSNLATYTNIRGAIRSR